MASAMEIQRVMRAETLNTSEVHTDHCVYAVYAGPDAIITCVGLGMISLDYIWYMRKQYRTIKEL